MTSCEYRSQHPLNGNRPAIGDPQLLRSRVGQHFPTSANIGGEDSQFLAPEAIQTREWNPLYNHRIRKYIHSFIYVRTHIYIYTYTWSLLTSTVSGLHRLHGAFQKNGAPLLASLVSPWNSIKNLWWISGSHIFSEPPICPISCCFRRWDSKLQHPGNRGFQKDHSTGQQDALGGECFGSALWGKIFFREERSTSKKMGRLTKNSWGCNQQNRIKLGWNQIQRSSTGCLPSELERKTSILPHYLVVTHRLRPFS